MGFLKRLLNLWSAQPEPCVTCGQPTRESLVREGREWVRYCRVHLVEEFARGVENAQFRMVVYEFQPQGGYGIGVRILSGVHSQRIQLAE